MVNAMTKRPNNPGPEELGFASRLFDASCDYDAIVADAPASRAVGFSELYRYVTEAEFRPRPELLDAVANDAGVRADVRALLRNRAVAVIPEAAAAAGEDEIDERMINGWRILIRRVHANPSQVWIIVEYADKAADMPRILFAGDSRHPLPESRDGRFQFRLDAESDLVKGLKDVAAEVFLV